MTAQPSSDPSMLRDRIAQQIASHPQRRISFAEFMDRALYDPDYGYYTNKAVTIGAQGDFFTSPHLGADFAELLAEQFAEMWELLDRPNPFTLLEMGAGQGLIVTDVARYLHRHHFPCFEALEYIILEKSPALIAAQQKRLAKMLQSWDRLSWRSWDEIPENSIVGCCFSNELIDAFPVHLVVASGQLKEVYVGLDENGNFVEVIDELSTSKIHHYFSQIAIDLTAKPFPDPYRTEVNLAALDWIKTVSDRLQKGYLLTIDYGYLANRYYSPTRSEGTLQCYYQHQHHSNPYIHIGQQDITAHVDFTTLQNEGKRCGLETIGFTQQGLFLMSLGLGDRIAALSYPPPESNLSIQDILQRREALHSLMDMNPMGLGNFGVLIQGKGLNEEERSLKGLKMPF